MAWRRMLGNWQLDPKEQTSVKVQPHFVQGGEGVGGVKVENNISMGQWWN